VCSIPPVRVSPHLFVKTSSPGPAGVFTKSCTSLPAQNESPATCQSTIRIPSSLAALLKISAKVTYMREFIAFFFAGRFNSTRRSFPVRSVRVSLIVCFLYSPREFQASRLKAPRAFVGAAKRRRIQTRFATGARSFALGTAPLACKPSISFTLNPSALRTSSLCSPISGARLAATLVTPCT
jgi:hypothetical protein